MVLTSCDVRSQHEPHASVVDPSPPPAISNGNQGTQTITEGTDAIVAMALVGAYVPTGTFTDRSGTVPW